MKNLVILLFLSLLTPLALSGQDLIEINSNQLSDLTAYNNDTTYVINFWATWCSPCVKEIGFFEDLHRLTEERKVEVVLVSLDFPNRVEKQLRPFLRERSITAPVRLMTDLDYNAWIDQVDPSWSGAIPATLIYKGEKRIFLEQELTREELFKFVDQISN